MISAKDYNSSKEVQNTPPVPFDFQAFPQRFQTLVKSINQLEVPIIACSGKEVEASVLTQILARQRDTLSCLKPMLTDTPLIGEMPDDLAMKFELVKKQILKVDLSTILKNLVHHSFKKIFNSRRLVKLFTGQPERMKLVNQIFENQIQIFKELIEATSHISKVFGNSLVDTINLPANALSEHIIDYFISEVVENQRNRYCYLQHLAMLLMLQKSAQLRDYSRFKEFAPKFLRVMPEYFIRIDEISQDLPLVMQLEDQEPLVDNQSITNINQIIMSSYNPDAQFLGNYMTQQLQENDTMNEPFGGGTKKQHFNLPLQEFLNTNKQIQTGDRRFDAGNWGQSSFNKEDASGGLRSQFYPVVGPASQSRRFTNLTNDAMSLEGQVHYKSLDGRMKGKQIEGSQNDSPEPGQMGQPMDPGQSNQPESQRRVQLLQNEMSGVGSQDSAGGPADNSSFPLLDASGQPQSSIRKISQTAIHDPNLSQNIQRMAQMNKVSFVRAASEPPQAISQGILNSKSIILPVQEETKSQLRVDGEDYAGGNGDQSDSSLDNQQNKDNKTDVRSREYKRDLRKKDHRDHLNQHITKNDLKGNNTRNQKGQNKLMTSSQEIQLTQLQDGQKKRNSSSFVVNTFLSGYSQQRPNEQQLMAHNQLSALSSQGRVSDNQQSQNNGTPGPHNISQGYQIVSQQNQLAMTRLSRRQLSYGQSQLSREKTHKLQTASNQVIAAYGDPRDSRFTASLGSKKQGAPSNWNSGVATGNQSSQKNIGTSDAPAAAIEDDDVKGEIKKHDVELSGSDESETEMSEKQDTMRDPDTNQDALGNAKSPLVPKLDLVQIHQDPKLGKQLSGIDQQIGHQKILATAGGPNLLATPGQQQNVVSFVNGAPPLTSHYPIITSCSPGKRGDQVFCRLDTSNRTSAIIPIQMGSISGPQRLLTSAAGQRHAFLNSGISAGHQVGQSVDEDRHSQAFALASGPRQFLGARDSSGKFSKHAQSFKQQRNNLILKLQQWHTQNNSEMNRPEGRGGLDSEETGNANILNGLINDTANVTNVSGNTTAGNIINRSNSLRILDGMAQSTINPLGGTQASNIIGMNLDSGAVHNIGAGGFLITNQDGQIIGNNSITKISEIASQLGQTYLVKDLASLIQQQRGMELVDTAKQTVMDQDKGGGSFKNNSMIFDTGSKSPSQPLRSKSLAINMQNSFLPMQKSEVKFESSKNHVNSSAHKSAKNTSKPNKVLLTRLIMLNMMGLLLQQYSHQEMLFINFNKPMQTITHYLQSRQHLYSGLGCSLYSIGNQVHQDQTDFYDTSQMIPELTFTLNSERVVIATILQKFAFANEDIMRQHVISQFVNKADVEKANFQLFNKIVSRSNLAIQNSSQSLNQTPSNRVSESDLDLFKANRTAALSFQDLGVDQDLNQMLKKMIASPNELWSNLGIAYDITRSNKVNGIFGNQQGSLGVHIPKDVLRRKLDILLYSTSQSIKNLIFKQTQDSQGYAGGPPVATGLNGECFWIDSLFAQNLTKQVVVLNSYIEGQSQQESRTLLNQIIDVCMESILMIKRVLSDVTLQQKIFIIDSSKQILPHIQQELLQRGRIIDNQLVIQDSNPDLQATPHSAADQSAFNTEIQAQRSIISMCYRQLFSEFLKLIRLILNMPQTCDTLKLLNEILLCNETWQETVKNYSISLWLQDVVSPTLVSIHWKYGRKSRGSQYLGLDQRCILYENLETLRGINILNFDEKLFSSQIRFIDAECNLLLGQTNFALNQVKTIELTQIANAQTKLLLLQLGNIMDYFKSIPLFYQQAVDIFFPSFSINDKEKEDENKNDRGLYSTNPMRYSYMAKSGTRNLRNMTNETSSRNGDAPFQYASNRQAKSPYANAGPDGMDYSGRNNGGQFPQNAQMGENQFLMKSVSGEQEYWEQSIRSALYQMSYWITNTNGLLNQYLLVNSSKYKTIKTPLDHNAGDFRSPIIFQLTVSVLTFLEKIFSLNQKFTKYTLVDEIMVFFMRTHQTNFAKLYNKNKKFLSKEGQENPRHAASHKNSMALCKLHLKCLYAIAKNRNEDCRQKLYQFQVVAFLAQELALENEYLMTRKQFLSVSKQMAKEANEADQFDIEEINSPLKPSTRFGFERTDKPNRDKSNDEGVIGERGYIIDPKQTKGQLQVGVIGASIKQKIEQEINKNLDPPGEEKQVSEFNANRDPPPFMSEPAEPSDSDDAIPPPLPLYQPSGPAKKFSLNITGLGISTVSNNDKGLTPEQEADLNLLRDVTKKVAEAPDDNSSSSGDGLPPPLPPQKVGNVPNLQIKGLGLSTISNDQSGLTAEQKADRDILRSFKFTNNNNLHDIKSETEMESQSNQMIESSADSKSKISPEQSTIKAANLKHQDSSSSDDGLPPPLPVAKTFALPKLAIGGLGLSTVAKDGGKTAEELGDMQILSEAKQKPLSKSSSGTPSGSDSDDGLPPPLPPSKPKGFKIPSLSVGGLGISTIAKDGQKTAEELADMQVLKNSKQAQLAKQNQKSESSYSDSDEIEPKQIQNKDQIESSGFQHVGDYNSFPIKVKISEEVADVQNVQPNEESSAGEISPILPNNKANQESSDSDAGLPPPLPKKPLGFKMPGLAIGGLGLSTVAKDGGKTGEELGDMQVLKDNAQNPKKNESSESPSDSGSSDDGLPPPLPVSKGFALPKLAIGGLGLSTVAKDGGKTAEELGDMAVLQQSKLNQQQKMNQDSSSENSDSDEQDQPEENNQKQSSSDSDDGLPPPIPKKPLGFKLPGLAIGGLGISTLKAEGQNMTQEEMADLQQLQASKNQKQAPSSSSSNDDEQLSSDEEQYRELQRQKAAENQSSPSQGQYEGGDSERSQNSQQNQAKNQKVMKFKTIDQKDQSNKGSIEQNPNLKQMKIIKPVSGYQKGLEEQKQEDPQKKHQIQVQKILKKQRYVNVNQPGVIAAHGQPNQQISQLLHPKQNKYQTQMNQQESSNHSIDQPSASNSSSKPASGNPLLHNLKQRNKKMNNFKTQTQVQSNAKREGNMSFPNQSKMSVNNSQIKLSKQATEQDGRTNTHVGAESIALQMKSQDSTLNFDQSQGTNLASALKKGHPGMLQSFEQTENDEPQFDDQGIEIAGDFERKQIDFGMFNKKSDQKQINASKQNERYQVRDQGDFQVQQQLKFEKQSSNSKRVEFKEEPAMPETKLKLSPPKNLLKLNLPDASTNSQNKVNQEQKSRQATLNRSKTLTSKKRKAIRVSKDDYYQQQRQKRPIYHDKELHTLMVAVTLCLLLQPQRGTLDDLYCHQYPIINGKLNYLYMLHQHLSHDQNQYIIQDLMTEMSGISPPLAGQRLIKLMCPQLFDLKLYNDGKDWKKLAVGAYGTVYECKTNLISPNSVAIKQMDVPSDITDRCVLHDIFTEITCLEEFRLEKCVTDLYDYGVDRQSYYIVMKKYACSLGDWRRKQGSSIEVFRKNLSLYISIFHQILKALRTIHSHNVTHYDLKCDNILINFVDDEEYSKNGQDTERSDKYGQKDLRNLTEDDFEITIGDFGECKIFSNEKDEFCVRNRGTDSIKSPEMLQLQIHTRKDHDKYDRRKQVGTNRLSDIWSIGCVFFELLTGEFLLYHPDWAFFFVKVIKHTEDLVPQDKLDMIDNNQYIKDFLKFILIRDLRLRPTIDKVIKRFEHIHAILCNVVGSSSGNGRPNLNNGFYNLKPYEIIKGNQELQDCLKQAVQYLQNSQDEKPSEPLSLLGDQHLLTRLMENLFMSTPEFLSNKTNIGMALQTGITHVVMVANGVKDQSLLDKFEILTIDSSAKSFFQTPIIMDFLRKSVLFKGRLLFVQDKNSNQIVESVLICLNQIFKTSTYEAYTLIKSQNLYFKIEASRLAVISKWNMLVQKITHFLTTFPQFSCHCGASLLILQRSYSQYQNIQKLVACNCPQKIGGSQGMTTNITAQEYQAFTSGPQNHYQTCPCASNPYVSCSEYLDFLKSYYQTSKSIPSTHISHSNNQLLWAYFDPQDFILCPNPKEVSPQKQGSDALDLETKRSQASSRQSRGNLIPKIPIAQVKNQKKIPQAPSDRQFSSRQTVSQSNKFERQIASNLSQTIDDNSIEVVAQEKIKNLQLWQKYQNSIPSIQNQSNLGNMMSSGQVPPLVPNSLNNGYGLPSSTSLLSNTPEPNSGRIKQGIKHENRWNIKKCAICHCWTYAYNPFQNKYAVLLNNRLNYNNQGLLSHKQNEKSFGMTSNLEKLEEHLVLIREEYFKKQAQQNDLGNISQNNRGPSIGTMYNQFHQNQIHSGGQIVRGKGMSSRYNRDAQGNDIQMTGGDISHENSAAKGFYGMTDKSIEGVRVPILKDISIQLPF